MDRQHHQRVLELFAATYELPEEARRELLDRECGDDPAIRAEVESLLTSDTEDMDFLEAPALGEDELERLTGSVTGMDARHENPGAVIGRYKLLQEIGEGGFGSVYMAEQTEPVQRKVALKVIKLGMDTKQVIARFEAERQALAMMDHPNVAKVLDAGATEAGRPYFVMELVNGVPITEYCDTSALSTTERLELFIDVCHSVQHAHQKGVIHRDIKPSNVLVTLHDGRPVPKIIDFGIAKATSARLTDKTMFTEFRQLVGTPAYMSPEQAEMSGLDVDTRSDIYALGVLLYELLTGTTPVDAERLRSVSYEELQRIIREEEPDRPSTRLSSLGGVARNGSSKKSLPSIQDVARHRRDDPAHLARSLRGDLDWVAMKCLEKDRSRRYETAAGLAADVRRHLDNQPVEAGPPTAAYRVRKFVRRNRVMVTAATLVVAALLAGTAGTTYGLLRAGQRERETQQVSDFQAAMLREIDVEAMGRRIKEHFREQVRGALASEYVGESPNLRQRTEREVDAELAAYDQRADAALATDVARRVIDEFVLARAAAALEEEQFAGQPLVRARLHSALGSSYRDVGLYSAAETHFRAARELQRRELGAEHPDTLTSTSRLGYVLWVQGGKRGEAERCYREAMEGRRRVLGDEHPDTLRSINDMGEVLVDHAPDEAEPFYREALAGRRRVLGDEHPATLTSIHNIGYLLWVQDRPAEAEVYYREVLEANQRAGVHDGTVQHNMGLVLRDLGRLDEAEPLFREVLEAGRRNYGNEHPDLLPTIHALASLLQDQGRLDEAELLCREVLEKCRRAHGDDYIGTLASLNGMGTLLEAQGKPAEAERHYREALAGARRVFGPDHSRTLSYVNNLGTLLQDEGRLADAESLLAEGTRDARAGLGGHPTTAMIEHHYADVLRELGHLDDALELARTAIDRYRAHPDWPQDEAACAREAMSRLGDAVARQAADESLAVETRVDKLREAEPLLVESADWLTRNAERIPQHCHADRIRGALERVADMYELWNTIVPDTGKAELAAEWRAKLDDLPGP